MESYEFNGEEYYFNKGKWLKSDYTVAPIGVINSLNMLLMEREEFETKTVDEIIQMLDGAKMSGNTGFALKIAEESMEKATLSEARALLPRITSLYRIKNRPERAVEVGEHYIRIYESKIWSPSLFTSLAAAYCDLNELEKARKYANRARAISGNNSSIELMSVYSRLKKLEEESPNIVRRDKEVEEVCDSILEPGNRNEYNESLITIEPTTVSNKTNSHVDIKKNYTKTYEEWVDEYPNTIVLRKEGWLFRAKDECAHVLSNSLGCRIMERENGIEEAGTTHLDIIIQGLKNIHINYIVIHFDEVIEAEEFNDNRYRNYLTKETEETLIKRKQSQQSEETLNVNAKEKDILAFIEALQNGADPMTGEILAEDSFIYASEMQKILEIAKEKIKAEASQDEKKTFENIIDKEEQALYEELRKCRMKIAKEYGIPAYTICHNSTLEEICRVKPRDRWEMLSISGVGEKAYEKYGDAFLSIINNQS